MEWTLIAQYGSTVGVADAVMDIEAASAVKITQTAKNRCTIINLSISSSHVTTEQHNNRTHAQTQQTTHAEHCQ